ncbi:ferredoxin [Streptomyces sp. SID3212]|uniref:ferredoxin n=1 Tax=Streptomyces sp. SID3212 TaxID=2690259 RepID=UPI0013689B6B|nr:ferredoxin [Streptomyces sp. SID3212]MYV53869.1 ferredoxin [Streptomyces sp. SID3212]
MTLYFDPLAGLGDDRLAFTGRWEDRLWLNVPGPFYGGETDTCWTGRLAAPSHVLYGGEYLSEYVYRQPKTHADTALLVEAADQDPFLGYGCDGDLRWTPETVREWWSERGRVTRYLADHRSTWDESDVTWGQGIGAAVRDFEAYIAGGLATDLRVYLYWLEERRSPAPGDRLPEL